MNATKLRVLKRYPNAYRRRRCEPWGGEPRQIHEICAYLTTGLQGKTIKILGTGTSSAAAWENAQANMLAEILTQ